MTHRPPLRAAALRHRAAFIAAAILATAFLAAVRLCAPAAAPAKASTARPNIIFILADDMGFADPRCQGHPYAKTPNLDRLAAEGTRFTQFYATGVTCCPARTGLMTGKFPASYQKYPASFGFGDRVTVTDLLKKQGYATGHFGKWHIGPEPKPGTYGIDVIGANDAEGPGADQGGKRRNPERGRDTPIYDEAIQFIETHKDQPFYLNVWSHISHNPINPAQRFVDEFKDLQVNEADFSEYQREKFATVKKSGGDVTDAVRRFLGDVYSLDLDIGRLLARLDQLGLRENTIVVFSADQGAAAPRDPAENAGTPNKKRMRDKDKPASQDRARLALNLMGYAGIHRGGKHTDYEGGVRVPFIMRWPAKVPAGRVDERSVLSGADWLPSLCAITGIKIDAANFDGEDSSAAWLGGVHTRAKPLFWKTNAEKSDPTIRWQEWKLHGSNRRRGTVELYNIAKDPAEKVNLAEKEPKVLADLTAKLKAWVETLPKTYEHGEGAED